MHRLKRTRGAAILLAALAGGCVARPPTADLLLCVTRGSELDDEFRLTVLGWENGALRERWTAPLGGADAPPRPLALLRSGREAVVEVRDAADGRARLERVRAAAAAPAAAGGPAEPLPTAREPAALENLRYDRVLDRDDSRLLLTQQIDRPARPVLRVSQGTIRELRPAWSRIARVDTADAAAPPAVIAPAAQPVARLGPLDWLVLVDQPARRLQRIDALQGTVLHVADWDAQRHVASAVVTPDGRRAVLAVQRVGERWNLFDLWRYDRETNGLTELVAGVYSATRPNASVSPALPMYAINDRHVAFVLTEVSEWRGRTPVEGLYHTAVLDLESGAVLVRIRNPQRGLRNEVPPPYLPAGRLAALRIDRTNPAAPAGGFVDEDDGDTSAGDERWTAFLTFRNGRLFDASGRSYDARTLGPYAYTREGNVLAVRERAPSGDRCLIFAGRRGPQIIERDGIERLVWLRPAGAAPPAGPD